jgi:hypothetical protein
MRLFASTMAFLLIAVAVATAQNAPPTYQADPDVYKVIFEDANFRIIAATWKKGARDKDHSHPVPSVAYALTDCSLRVHAPDGTTRDITPKAGSAMPLVITASHFAENVGGSDCRSVIVERK